MININLTITSVNRNMINTQNNNHRMQYFINLKLFRYLHFLDCDASSGPVLQQSYSVVADELPRAIQATSSGSQAYSTYSTYAEIEECSDVKDKPKPALVSKRSVDNSKRQLPAKPDVVPASSIYVEIGDSEAKDTKTEKASVESKNKRNAEDSLPDYSYKKKLSNASNIYAECEDVREADDKPKEKDKDLDKTYMDMTHKRIEEASYTPHSKDSKDKVNQSKRSRVRERPANRKPVKVVNADSDAKKKLPTDKEVTKSPGSKKKSVASDSDSDDDDTCVVENELYEPFETAKV